MYLQSQQQSSEGLNGGGSDWNWCNFIAAAMVWHLLTSGPYKKRLLWSLSIITLFPRWHFWGAKSLWFRAAIWSGVSCCRISCMLGCDRKHLALTAGVQCSAREGVRRLPQTCNASKEEHIRLFISQHEQVTQNLPQSEEKKCDILKESNDPFQGNWNWDSAFHLNLSPAPVVVLPPIQKSINMLRPSGMRPIGGGDALNMGLRNEVLSSDCPRVVINVQ